MGIELLALYERVAELEGTLQSVCNHIADLSYLDANAISDIAEVLAGVLADKVIA
jgi:hypothetical protein